jgi:hypothetical protein
MPEISVPDPWQNESVLPLGGQAFAALIASLREVQDIVNGCNPPEESMVAARAGLDSIADLLRPSIVPEDRALAGKRPDLPGRGYSLLPAFIPEEQSANHIAGRVRFTRFYLGGNGAAHGGTIPLLFDDVLGRLSNSGGRPRARSVGRYAASDTSRSKTPIWVYGITEIRRPEALRLWEASPRQRIGGRCGGFVRGPPAGSAVVACFVAASRQ